MSAKNRGILTIGRPGMPQQGLGGGRAAYGSRVYIQRPFIERLKGFILSDENRKNLLRVAGELVLEPLWPKRIINFNPFLFWEDTPIPQTFEFGYDGKSMGAKHDDIAGRGLEDDWVIYQPKNIDSPIEAYALLGLATLWLDYVDQTLDTPRKRSAQ